MYCTVLRGSRPTVLCGILYHRAPSAVLPCPFAAENKSSTFKTFRDQLIVFHSPIESDFFTAAEMHPFVFFLISPASVTSKAN